MNRNRLPLLRPVAVLGALLAGLALAGCFNPFSPRIAPILGASIPAPKPTSAPGVLRLFEWCYNHKAIAEYREIFTDDYRFYFSPLDSAGAEWRGTPFTREDELISATKLFVGGGANEPAASSINLKLDPNFFVYPDPDYTFFPEPNRTVPRDPLGRWHKNIRTTVTLRIGTEDGASIEITGHANFYMVRGDSALIPEELRLRGFGPDSTRWYIRRWDDETALEGGVALAAGQGRTVGSTTERWGLRARATRSAGTLDAQGPLIASWGALKAYFYSPAAAVTALRPQGP